MSASFHVKVACLFTCVLLLAGCRSEKPKAERAELPPVDAPQAGAAETATHDSDSVSMDEALQFARGWEAAAQAGDAAAGVAMIDFDSMIDRMFAPFDVDAGFRREFTLGIEDAHPIERFVAELGENEQAGGNYSLVHVASRGGQPHAVFRLLGADGSLNYHDLRVVRSDDGATLQADQIFVAMSGEDMSDTLRAMAAPIIRARRSALGQLNGEQKRVTNDMIYLREMFQLAKLEENEKAIEAFNKLSPEGRLSKPAQLGRLVAYMRLDDDRYMQAIDDYAKRFPGDPSLGLILMDAAVMRKDAGQLDQAYAALNEWTGGDPLLDLMVAAVLATFGQVDRAQKIVAETDVDALQLSDAHDYALSVSLIAGDHKETLAQLQKLRDDFGYEFTDLQGVEEFKAFVASPEFQTWDKEQNPSGSF